MTIKDLKKVCDPMLKIWVNDCDLTDFYYTIDDIESALDDVEIEYITAVRYTETRLNTSKIKEYEPGIYEKYSYTNEITKLTIN